MQKKGGRIKRFIEVEKTNKGIGRLEIDVLEGLNASRLLKLKQGLRKSRASSGMIKSN